MDRTERLRKDEAGSPLQAHIFGPNTRNMPGIAQALRQNGLRVTEAPLPDSSRASRTAEISNKVVANPFRLPRKTSLLLHEADVPRRHPLRIAALRRSIPQQTPTDVIEIAMRNRIGVIVAGGRLAGIAAAMIGWVLTRAGKDPSVLLDKPSKQLGGCSRLGSGAHFVAEWSGDARELARIKPCLTLFLDLDPHVENRPCTEAEACEASVSSFRRDTESGLVLALGHPSRLQHGPPEIQSRGMALSSPLETFSLRRGSSWWGTDLRDESAGPRFRVFHKGDYVVEVRLQILGLRNIVGALAAVSACRALGLSAMEIGEALEEFQGTSHDFELRGTFRGVNLVHDPAQRPGAIRETLSMARQTFKRRRLWVVIEPPALDFDRDFDEISRFETALGEADQVILVDAAEPNRQDQFDALESPLLKKLNTAGPRARRVSDVIEAIAELDGNLEPGDVLLTLGPGDVGTIADAFIRRLPRDRQGG